MLEWVECRSLQVMIQIEMIVYQIRYIMLLRLRKVIIKNLLRMVFKLKVK